MNGEPVYVKTFKSVCYCLGIICKSFCVTRIMWMNTKKLNINVCFNNPFTVAVLKLKDDTEKTEDFPAQLHNCYYFESNKLFIITLPYKQKPKQISAVEEQHSQNWISRWIVPDKHFPAVLMKNVLETSSKTE